MTSDRPTTPFAPDGASAEVVSIIDRSRNRSVAITPRCEPSRSALEYGACWYHEAAIRCSKEVH